MNATLKLQLAFQSLDHLIGFYVNKIGKKHMQALATITAMGCKGSVIYNPDDSITVTWFFRNKSKYDKFITKYLEYTACESYYKPENVNRLVYY